MSSESATTVSQQRTGFLEKDLRKFFKQGATQSVGTANTAVKKPSQITQTFQASATKKSKFFDPANPEVSQTGAFEQVGGPKGTFIEALAGSEDQLSQLVQAFEGRRQNIKRRLRQPGLEQSRITG